MADSFLQTLRRMLRSSAAHLRVRSRNQPLLKRISLRQIPARASQPNRRNPDHRATAAIRLRPYRLRTHKPLRTRLRLRQPARPTEPSRKHSPAIRRNEVFLMAGAYLSTTARNRLSSKANKGCEPSKEHSFATRERRMLKFLLLAARFSIVEQQTVC